MIQWPETSPRPWSDEAERPEAGEAEVPRHRSRLTTAAQRRNRPEPRWTIQHVLPEYGVGQLYGPSYTGKSFVALDLALRLANESETAWFGRRVCRHGPVVYVLMEGAWDFGQRIEAWLRAHPGTSDAELYTLEEEPLDLRSSESVDLLARDVEALFLRPSLLVVDTQSLATPGTNENDNSEMNEVFANLKALAKRLGCFVLTVHHTGHDQSRARGASAQFAALDVEIRVEAQRVSVTKVKAFRPWDQAEGFRLTASGPSAVVERIGYLEALVQSVDAGEDSPESRILKVLRESGPLSATELCARAGGRKERHLEARASLEAAGAIVRRGGRWSLPVPRGTGPGPGPEGTS